MDSTNQKIKTEIFFLLRKLGGHRLSSWIKTPVGDSLIKEEGKSPFYEERRHTVAKLLDMTKNVKGDAVECGVLEGYTTIIMGKKLK